MRYIIGILMAAIGVILVLKTEWFIQNFGTSAWAEAKFGYNGGTRLMYKLVGTAFIFFGFLTVTNMISGFLFGTVGKIFIR
ncbi:MAG: hypothetical protein AAB348_01895 [Patescibacteria group bacterium]